MDQNIKAQWVAELRSGNYQQGAFKLNSNGKFCCLGVLCEIAREAGIVESSPFGNTISYLPADLDYSATASDFEDTILPRVVSAWAGLETGSPDVWVDPDQTRRRPLTTINDQGTSFTEIANMIDGSL